MEKELLFFSYDVFGIPFVDPVSGTAARQEAAGGTCLQGKGMWYQRQVLIQLLMLSLWL